MVLAAAAAAAVPAGGAAAAFSTLAGPASTSTDTAAASLNTHGDHQHPAVVSFSASRPTCKAGASVATLKLSWKVTGADGATVAVDGLGEYGQYGASSSLKLNIPCDGASHTYNVWPNGAQDALKTLTVTPKTQS